MKLATKLALLLICTRAFGQNPNTAAFPSAVATDSTLGVAKDNAQTTLASGINNSQTNLTMAGSNTFRVYSFITIGSEQMQVCTSSGTAVTVCSRGANGTSAATHALGATVRANVIGYYTNQANAEIKAVETLLGVNGTALGFQNVVYYQWSQTPGGSISIGANTVTLTPGPFGVNGSAAALYAYLSSGAGTAETVQITAGTCDGTGQTSCTVTFTAANTHSGAWSIGTASGGLREAILAANGNALIRIPPNTTLLVSAPTSSAGAILIDKTNLTIAGGGWSSVVKYRDSTGTMVGFDIPTSAGNGATFRDFSIDGNRANNTFAGSPTGIKIGTYGTAFGPTGVLVDHLEIFHTHNWGVYAAGDATADIEIANCYIHNNGGVTNTSGGGTGIQSFNDLVDLTIGPRDVRAYNNYIKQNYNTVHTVGVMNVGACIFNYSIHAEAIGNVCEDNYNITGGQVGGRGVWDGNAIIHTTNQASDDGTSCMEFSAAGGLTITNNLCIGASATGSGIVLEGDAGSPGTYGAQDTTIVGNYVSCLGGPLSSGIALINAGGKVRGITIQGNRVRDCLVGIAIDTGAEIVTVVGNNVSDNTTFLVDNSIHEAILTGNIPAAANLLYGGSTAAAITLTVRCGGALTVSGAGTVKGLNVPATYTSVGGCTATLIPASGATWVTDTSSNIGFATTAVPGKAIIFTFDGTLWWPSY